MGSKRTIRISILALAGLLSSAFLGSASAATGCEEDKAFNTVMLHRLNVEIEARDDAYPRGTKAKIDADVTRTLDKDPTGTGVAPGFPYEEPAGDVNVGVGLIVGGMWVGGDWQLTDAQGEALMKPLILGHSPYSWAKVGAFAWKVLAQDPQGCATLMEVGEVEVSQMFRVTR